MGPPTPSNLCITPNRPVTYQPSWIREICHYMSHRLWFFRTCGRSSFFISQNWHITAVLHPDPYRIRWARPSQLVVLMGIGFGESSPNSQTFQVGEGEILLI